MNKNMEMINRKEIRKFCSVNFVYMKRFTFKQLLYEIINYTYNFNEKGESVRTLTNLICIT